MAALSVLPETFAICRLDRNAVPLWAGANDFISITQTTDESSIVCRDSYVPQDVKCDRGWRALKVAGPLDLALTGVIASLVDPLAKNQINLFAISTFDTDYLLVKEYNLARACVVLRQAGFEVLGE